MPSALPCLLKVTDPDVSVMADEAPVGEVQIVKDHFKTRLGANVAVDVLANDAGHDRVLQVREVADERFNDFAGIRVQLPRCRSFGGH